MYISWNSWNFLERKQVHVGSQELPSPKKCINNPKNVPANVCVMGMLAFRKNMIWVMLR